MSERQSAAAPHMGRGCCVAEVKALQGKITELSAEAGRVRVRLDASGSFTLARVVASRLGLGQQLSPADVHRLKQLDRQERARQHALRLLARRQRSEHELRQSMRRRGLTEGDVQAVLDQLRQGGWLGDLAFAHAWIENRQTFRPRSARALRHELRQKGVDAQTIEAALDGFNETEAAEAAARVGARKYAGLPETDFRQRLAGYLSRRGFAYSSISPLLKRKWRELSEEESEGLT